MARQKHIRVAQQCKKCRGDEFHIVLVTPDPKYRPGARVADINCAACGANVAAVGQMSIGQRWDGIVGKKE